MAHYTNDRLTAAIIQILELEFSLCMVQPAVPIWTQVVAIFRITRGAAMCILVIAQSVRQSVQMYRVTKQWQVNQYMSLLIQQGNLYFFAYVLVSSFSPSSLLPNQAREFVHRTNGRFPSQDLSVRPRRYIGCIGQVSNSRMATDIAGHSGSCAHLHPDPSIHYECSGVVHT